MTNQLSAKRPAAYINGNIYTVNQSRPWINALIVSSDGMITSVGSTDEIRSEARTRGIDIYDLENQFVMPGIHDAHMHVLMAGLQLLSGVNLDEITAASNVAEAMSKGLCSCAHPHVYGGWNKGSTFMVPDFDRSCLDEQFPDSPVYIHAGGGHSMYANTALLNKAGYDIQNEADSQASFFVRRSDGSLTGEMRELAMTKASLALPKPDPAHIKKALDRGIQEAHSAGVTSLQEPSANSVLMRALAELERQGALKMVVFTHVVDAPEHLAGESRKDLHALIETVNKFESPHVHTDYIKFMLDGVPVPPLYTQCDLDSNGQPDESKVTVPDLVERILHHDAAGRTVKIHATGHGSVRMALDAISQARKQNPGGPKHEIAHCNSVHEEDYARFQQLNVTAEMSPAFFFMHPAGAATPELFDWNFPKFMERNAHITIGSDWGGTFDLPLFQYLDGVVERVGDGFRERGGERLLRMITLAGAEAVGKGDQFGSIEVGKKANFIVVDKNLSKGEFAGAKVLKTWFEGELVFDGSNK